MTDQPPPDSKAVLRRWLIAKYDATRDEDYLRAALCLDRGSNCLDKADILLAPDNRGRGRSSEDDFDELVQMALMIKRDGISRWAAAQKAAAENPGHSEDSTARRLYRKFRENPDPFIWTAEQFLAFKETKRALDQALDAPAARFNKILANKVK